VVSLYIQIEFPRSSL